MKGTEKFWAGAPDFMKKKWFWPAFSAAIVGSIALCAVGGVYDISPTVENTQAAGSDENTDDTSAKTKADELEAAAAAQLAEKKRIEEEQKAAEEAKYAEEEKQTEETRQQAEAAKKAAEQSIAQPKSATGQTGTQSQPTNTSKPVTTTPQSSTTQNVPSNSHYVHGYCKDGMAVYGDPTAKGKANACYGHKGWRDEY